MDDIPLSVLYSALACLLLLSAFFSSSETGLMSLNRYRLKHLARDGHPGAVRAARLLKRPDRLIGLILLGNNLVNIMASSLTTVIALRHGGDAALAIGVGILTLVVLIFAEVAPKTLAALHPERIAFPAAFIYGPLLKITYPAVWTVNLIANRLLRIIGVRVEDSEHMTISNEELRTVVHEAGAILPRKHQRMLMSILDLEQVTVEDIMVPRNEVVGLDLEQDWNELVDQIRDSQYTKLPVYRNSIENVVGFLHLRKVVRLLTQGKLDKDTLLSIIRDPHYIPEGTPLNKQLINFQRTRHRIGLVVDEYGEIMGLVTLEDILEEIVGEFTTDPSQTGKDIHPQGDGSYLVDGSVTVRDLNRALNWHLPTDGPKTINGLVLEHLETIPEPGTSVLIADHPIEIIQIQANAVKTLKILPRLEKPADEAGG